MILFKFTLELPFGWTLAAGMGRAGAEDDADESEVLDSVGNTEGSFQIEDGLVEAYYDEDDDYVIEPSDPQCLDLTGLPPAFPRSFGFNA